MVLVTVPVAVSIPDTDTEPAPTLATYAVLPSGVTATPPGPVPTVMALVTVPVAVSITDTEPDPSLVTDAVLAAGVTATRNGLVPTVMVLVAVSLPPRREERAPGALVPFWPSAAAVVCVFIGIIPIVVNAAAAIMTITIPTRCFLVGTLMSTRSCL